MFFSEKNVLENAAAFLKLRAGVDIRSKCKLKATPLPSIERLREGWGVATTKTMRPQHGERLKNFEIDKENSVLYTCVSHFVTFRKRFLQNCYVS